MALETPNRETLTFTAFYAVPDIVPPGLDNDAIFVLTAAVGLKSLTFPPTPTFSGTFEDGLMVEPLQPVNSAEAIFFVHGWPSGGEESPEDSVTPWAIAPTTSDPVVDAFAASNGNYLYLFPDIENFGFMGVSIFQLPKIDGASLPTFPLGA